MTGISSSLDVTGRDGKKLRLVWTAFTHAGFHREANDDSFWAEPPVWAVADGMGGHDSGDVASRVVVECLSRISPSQVSPQAIVDALRLAVTEIADRVGETKLGAGTTVTGVALWSREDGLNWLIFNLGDSRVYSLYKGQLDQLTVDHSVVWEMVANGQLSPEEAPAHPYSNIITRAVGFGEDPIPDFSYLPLLAGMRLIICSDGLTKELDDLVIAALGSADGNESSALKLMEGALSRGGRDNVTVLVLDVLET